MISEQSFLLVFSEKIHHLARKNLGVKGIMRSKIILAFYFGRILKSGGKIFVKTKWCNWDKGEKA
jgi:hypothetical protein